MLILINNILSDTISSICFALVIAFSTFTWLNKYVPINYGKQLSSNFKFQVNGRIAWFLFEVPNLIIAIMFMIQNSSNKVNYVMILPFLMHYVNRSIFYPLSLKGNIKPLPIEVFIFSSMFTISNSYLQAQSILSIQDSKWSDLLRWNVLIGFIIFVYGMWINISSDKYLQSLKKDISEANQKTGEKKDYVIPRKGFFKYVTQANYFGEVVEWFGFAIFQIHSTMPWVFAFATLSILSSRAVESHKWYKNKFSDYPKERKAIIPYIF